MVVDNMAAQWTYSDLTDVDTVIERVIGLAPNTVNIPGIRKHDLAERLFLSQMAGGNRINGVIQGDKRCTPGGRTSNLGWVRVDKANGTVPINLRFTDTAKDARIGLALMYWTCRMTNLPSDCVRSAGNATAPTANADARVSGIS
jgi:hypothetical protein